MTASAPWSVKGIDPKAREIAKDLARRSGMTLGEWLNQMILEDVAPEPPAPSFSTPVAAPDYERFEAPEHPGDDVLRASEALDRLSARIEAAEQRATLAISGIGQSVSGVLNRLETAEREQTAVSARFEGAVGELAEEHARIADRLQRMEAEAVAPPSVEAVRSMEGALAKVASHLYDGEARAEQRFSELRRELDGLNAQLAAGPAAGIDEQAEAVVERLAGRLSEAEDRTSAAMRGLESSFAQLDERLAGAETRIEGRAAETSLEQLAASLSARVDAARAEMADKIREAADGRFERMERTLSEMTGHVEEAERRSTSAIERMGHEVLRMADTLGRKVQEVEHRSADAIEQVGGEVARMSHSVEARLERSDEAGAKALEKLGGEIARITERLSERIANAERRSAQAMDDVGEQVSRVSERLQDRQERTSTELSERIRLSEERTARLLEDARERIDQRLEETQKRLAETAAAAVAAQPPVAGYGHNGFVDPEVGPFGRERFDPPPSNYVDPAPSAFREEDFAPLGEPATFAGQSRFEPETARFADPARVEPEADIFVDDEHSQPTALTFGERGRDSFEPGAEPQSFGGFGPDDLIAAPEDEDPDAFVHTAAPEPAPALEVYEPAPLMAEPEPEPVFEAHEEPADEPQRAPATVTPLSTRELIEQARAAARAANLSPAEARAGKARKTEPRGGMFGGLGRKTERKTRRGGSTLTTALFVSGGAAALSVALVGYELVLQKPGGALPSRVAEVMGLGGPASPAKGEKPGLGEGGQPLAAVALAPTPAGAPAAATPTAAQNEAGAEIYADGVRRVEAKDNSGVAIVTKAANLGYAPAQFYLAKLYEAGGAGLKKDPGQARVWTERAADGGDQKAMHNLALYYFEGTGGPKNTTLAAQWFHRAADLGLVDSQYNLARLYEEGFGVSQNPAEAYKWYLIAAKAGDTESRTSAQRLKSQLSPEAQTAAERAAAGFQAQGPQLGTTQLAQATVSGGATGVGASADIATAQRGLSRLGYYQGPYDGVNSPALSLAIAAYQRDQGLPSTGALDGTVIQRLSAAAQ